MEGYSSLYAFAQHRELITMYLFVNRELKATVNVTMQPATCASNGISRCTFRSAGLIIWATALFATMLSTSTVKRRFLFFNARILLHLFSISSHWDYLPVLFLHLLQMFLQSQVVMNIKLFPVDMLRKRVRDICVWTFYICVIIK